MALTPFVRFTWWGLIFIMIVIVIIVIISSIYQWISNQKWDEATGSDDAIMNILGNLGYLGVLYGVGFIFPIFVVVSLMHGVLNLTGKKSNPVLSYNARNAQSVNIPKAIAI